MNNRSIMVSALLMLVIVVATAGTASAAGSVVRDLPDTPVSPGEEITVGLTQSGFGFDVVAINPEVLPDGFVYVHGSYTGITPPEYDPATNRLILGLGFPGELSVTYRVTAGSAEQIESAVFRGLYRGFSPSYSRDWGMVTGDSTLELGAEGLPKINSVELNETEVTTDDPILVTVDATDNVGVVNVTAEGVGLALQVGDIWAGVIIAKEGTHTVNVCARDAAGNVAWNNSTAYTATAPDMELPVIHSVELDETEVTTGDPIPVTVNATDNVGVANVTAEGVELAPQGGNIWAGVIMAGLGENIVHVSARDAAGNVGWNNSTSYNGEWDNGPNISISITPASKNVSAGGTYTINITVDPNATAIQGAQADLIFDPNFVTVDGLSNVGDIFEGHGTTYETVYLIDNVNGVVSSIGSAITDGNVTTSAGALATVTLTVNGSATGDSALELINTEVTVDSIPVRPPDLVVNNGTLIIDTTEPDLIVESITPNCGGYLFGNESNDVCAVIKNNGTGNAGASHACFVLNGYSETVSVSPLDAGASETVCITDPTIRNAGDAVTITVTADCNGEVTESNETNNVSTLDSTVVNNGYKGKRYTGGEDITTLATYDINGNLVYSVGDSYYRGGYSGWSTPSYTANWTAGDLPVPPSATIEEVRLYVPYCFDYQGDMPDNLSLKFNGNAQTLEQHYTDRKSHGDWDNPYGMLTYNVTDDFDTGGNTANLTNSNPKCGEQRTVSIRGMILVVIYEDATEPRRQIVVGEEFDLLYGGSGKCTTPEEATAWAPITGPTIDTSETASARLITFAPGADGPEGELIFNGQVWNDVWSFAGDTQIGIDERDVASYLESTGNLVGFQSNGDYMEASNAILVVEYGEPVLNMAVTATPPSVTVNTSTPVLFNVTSDSTPVVGATVTLSGAFDNVSTTGADGTVTIEVNATSTGTIDVTATKAEHEDAEITVTVSESGLPQTGDIDGSGGDPTMNDAVYLAKHVVGLSGYETIYADGDIDGSGGDPTMNDAVYLAKHVVGLSGYETIY